MSGRHCWRPLLRYFVVLREARLPGRLVSCDGLFFCFDDWGGGFDVSEGDEAGGSVGLLQDLLAVEFGHAGVFGVQLDLRVACADLFFARVLRDAGLLEGVVGGGAGAGREQGSSLSE